MKNTTISVVQETYRWSRFKAAEIGTSVSALACAYLVDLVEGRVPESRFAHLRRLQYETLEAIGIRAGGLRAADNLPHDTLHERDVVTERIHDR